MATLFSLNDGNFTDPNVFGFSLTGAEITNNTTGISIPSNKTYYTPFAENANTYILSAISVHLSAVSESPTGNFSLIVNKINKSSLTRTTVVETYPINTFTVYDGNNNFNNLYPANWHTLKLTNPITVLSSENIQLCLSASTENELALMGSVTAINKIENINPTIAGTLSTTSEVLPYSYFTQSLYFNGTTNWFTFPANSRYALSGDFTIEFWIKTSTFSQDTSYRRIFAATTTNIASNLEIIFLNSSEIKVYAATTTLINGTIAVADGNWHHVALTRNSGAMKLFIDGAQSGATYNSTTNFSAGSASGITIGKYGGASNGRFQGHLSNLHVVNGTSLYNFNFTTTPTVLEPVPTSNSVILLNSGIQLDKALIAANNYTLTAGPLIEFGTITRSTSGTYFNGIDSKIEFYDPNLSNQVIPANQNFTLEILFNVKQAPNVSFLGVNIFSMFQNQFDFFINPSLGMMVIL